MRGGRGRGGRVGCARSARWWTERGDSREHVRGRRREVLRDAKLLKTQRASLSRRHLLRKLLPRSVAEGHLSVSFDSFLRRKRVHSVVMSAFSPVGLVHWLHAVAALIAVSSGSFDETLGRTRLLALYAGAGACSSIAAVLTQVVFGRRAQARSSVSGALMGLLLLRAAAMPDVSARHPRHISAPWSLLHLTAASSISPPPPRSLAPRPLAQVPIDLGTATLPPLRVALIHIGLDAVSNALPPPPAVGLEKLLPLLGAAGLVSAVQPQLRELFAGATAGGWDWKAMLEYFKAAI